MPIYSTDGSPKLEPWQPEGVTIHEGEPNGRGFTLHEAGEGDGFVGAYLFECDPGRTSYRLVQNEILHVLEGEVEITLDDGSKVELSPGGVAFLTKGQMSHWWFKTRFKEMAIVAG
ncbi:MAG: DUF861 domain-containing protein [Actinobacteria bacterium]|nr:DUF861 domain-containing protein [Actinomycetota bacterium]